MTPCAEEDVCKTLYLIFFDCEYQSGHGHISALTKNGERSKMGYVISSSTFSADGLISDYLTDFLFWSDVTAAGGVVGDSKTCGRRHRSGRRIS